MKCTHLHGNSRKNPNHLRISQYISAFNRSVRSTNLTLVKFDNDLSCMWLNNCMKLKWIHTFQTFASHLETACVCLNGGFAGELVSSQISAIVSKQKLISCVFLKGFSLITFSWDYCFLNRIRAVLELHTSSTVILTRSLWAVTSTNPFLL